MKLNILAIERRRPDWARLAFESYKNRFDKSIQVKWLRLSPVKRIKALDKGSIIKIESKKLISSTKEGEILISLDKEGRSWSTFELKDKFEDWLSSSKEINFFIGGPDGLSSECLKKSHEVWSVSKLTLPHVIIPVLVIEQLYRVWSIGKNHPYHR